MCVCVSASGSAYAFVCVRANDSMCIDHDRDVPCVHNANAADNGALVRWGFFFFRRAVAHGQGEESNGRRK